jgi:serine/threonine-protein kinase
MTLEAGTVLGRYRIESLIGHGGMGAVYLALDTQLDRRVALKILSAELAHDERFRERFIAESRIAASLDHPHIVPVYEAGAIDGQLFIAMRYIDGNDLSTVLAQRPRLPTGLIVHIVAGVAAALDAAHGRGLVHRDVKPGNVLLAGPDEAPLVFLTDFGLSKRVGDPSLTRAGQIVGSIGYVAPEQVEGRAVDARTDVYSLGCLTYELFTGGQPFRRDSEMATLLAHVQQPPPSLLAQRPELPETLDAALARAMAKDPVARFASAGEFAAAVAASVRPDSGAITRGFLFADLRGYTAYVERHGDAAASTLLDVYRRLMRETIARHGGAEIKTEGDSFYVVFPSASGAVQCGLSIVAAAAAHSQADPEHPIRVGVGVNAGEAVAADEGYVGSAVNIAARVCAQAQPGEVLVTDTVRGLTRTSGRLAFTAVGRRALKGIAEPVALFRVEPAGNAGVRPPAGGRLLGGRPRAVVAVGGLAVVGLAVAVAGGTAVGLLTGGRSPSVPPAVTRVERIAYAAIQPPGTASSTPCADGWESRLMLAAPDGRDTVRLLRPTDNWELRPAWSPDGTRIAFVGTDQLEVASLYVVAPDGSELRNVTPSRPPGVDEFSASISSRPAWSADGQRLLFSYGVNGIWEVNTDGTGLHRLIAPPAEPPPTPDERGNLPEVFPREFGTVTWMPDGRIAVDVTQDNKDHPSHAVLYAASADGTGLARLPGMPADLDLSLASWAPDGRLAFVSYTSQDPDRHDQGDLYILDSGSAEPRKVPGTTGISGAAAWSPDGKRLAFAAGALYTIKDDGTDRQRVATDPGVVVCSVAWGRMPDSLLPKPTASPAPGTTPVPQPFHRGDLAAGTYVTEQFVPRMQFHVDAGWVALLNFVDGLALARADGKVEEEMDVGLVQVVFDSPCVTGKTRTIGPSAREFFEFLRGNPYLRIGNPRAIVIGGKTGLAADVTVKRTPTAATCPDEPEQLLDRVWLFQIGETSYWFRGGQKVRFVSIDAGDGPAVTFVFGGDPKGSDAFIEVGQRLIDSLTFP